MTYLFAYFIGNGEDGLHLASSTDGYRFEALHGGASLLTPTVGESKLMRDPFLFRSPDGIFHLLWTTAWDGQTIGYAASPDLKTWSEQRALPVMTHEPDVANCWAPEAVWDDTRNRFLLFWASTIRGRFPETDGVTEGTYNHRMYCTDTTDFVTFGPTRLFFDPGHNVIDATYLRDADGKLHLIYKDETLDPVRKHLRIVAAETAEGPFGMPSPPFTPDWVEGPAALRVNDDYLVYFDCYREHRYGAMRSRDLQHWEDVSELISFPEGARHGSVIAPTPFPSPGSRERGV